MNQITSETTFETAIIQSLVESDCYTEGDADGYSPELGMFKTEVLQFLQSTQAKQWDKLSAKYAFEEMFIDKLIDRMDQNQELFEKILEDQSFGELVKELMMKKVYARLNENIK